MRRGMRISAGRGANGGRTSSAPRWKAPIFECILMGESPRMNAENCRLSTNKEKPVQQQVGARFVSADPFFSSRRKHLVAGLGPHVLQLRRRDKSHVESIMAPLG